MRQGTRCICRIQPGGDPLAWHRFSSSEMHFYLLEVELESLTSRNDSPGLDVSFSFFSGGALVHPKPGA